MARCIVISMMALMLLLGCSRPDTSETELKSEKKTAVTEETEQPASFPQRSTSGALKGEVKEFIEALDDIYADSKGMEAKRLVADLKIKYSTTLFSVPADIRSKLDAYILHRNGCAAGIQFSCSKATEEFEDIMYWCGQ